MTRDKITEPVNPCAECAGVMNLQMMKLGILDGYCVACAGCLRVGDLKMSRRQALENWNRQNPKPN